MTWEPLLVLPVLFVLVQVPGRWLWRVWRANGGELDGGEQRARRRLSQLLDALAEQRARFDMLDEEVRRAGYQPDDAGPYLRASELFAQLAQAERALSSAAQPAVCWSDELRELPQALHTQLWRRFVMRYFKRLARALAAPEAALRDASAQLVAAEATIGELRRAPLLVAQQCREAVRLLAQVRQRLDECARAGLAGAPVAQARQTIAAAAALLDGLPAHFTDTDSARALEQASRLETLGVWRRVGAVEQLLRPVDQRIAGWQQARHALEAARHLADSHWRAARSAYTSLPPAIDGQALLTPLRQLGQSLRQLQQESALVAPDRLSSLAGQAQTVGKACERLAGRFVLAGVQSAQLQASVAHSQRALAALASRMDDAGSLQPHPLHWAQSAALLGELRDRLARLSPPERRRAITALELLLDAAAQLDAGCQRLERAVQASLALRREYGETWQRGNIPTQPDWPAQAQQLHARAARYDIPQGAPNGEIAGLLRDAEALLRQSDELAQQHHALLHTSDSPQLAEAGAPADAPWPAVDRALSELRAFVAALAQLRRQLAECERLLSDLGLRERAALTALAETLAACDADLSEAEQIIGRLSATTAYPLDPGAAQAELRAAQQARDAAAPGAGQPVLPQIEAAQQRAATARAQAAALRNQSGQLGALHTRLRALYARLAPVADPTWPQAVVPLQQRCASYAPANWGPDERPHELLVDARALQARWRGFNRSYPPAARGDAAHLGAAHHELDELARQVGEFAQRCKQIKQRLDDLQVREGALREQVVKIKNSIYQTQSLIGRPDAAPLAGLKDQWAMLQRQLHDCEAVLEQHAQYSVDQRAAVVAEVQAAYTAQQQALTGQLDGLNGQLRHALDDLRRKLAALGGSPIVVPAELAPLRWDLQQIVGERDDLLDADQDLPQQRPQAGQRGDLALLTLEAQLAAYARYDLRRRKQSFLIALLRFLRDYEECQDALEHIRARLEAGWPRLEGSVDAQYDRWRDLQRRVAAVFETLPYEQLQGKLAEFAVEIGQIGDGLPRLAEQLDRQVATLAWYTAQIDELLALLRAVRNRNRRRQFVVELDEFLIDVEDVYQRLKRLPRRPAVTHREAVDRLADALARLSARVKHLQDQGYIAKQRQ